MIMEIKGSIGVKQPFDPSEQQGGYIATPVPNTVEARNALLKHIQADIDEKIPKKDQAEYKTEERIAMLEVCIPNVKFPNGTRQDAIVLGWLYMPFIWQEHFLPPTGDTLKYWMDEDIRLGRLK